MLHALETLVDRVLDLLAPARCSGCDEPCASQKPFCESCARQIQPVPVDRLDGVTLLSGAAYAPPVSTAIQRLKYQARPDLAGRLAGFAVEQTSLFDVLGRVHGRALFVPVPLHPRRLAERGYNQSALVARALARRACGEYAPRLLIRSIDTAQQASLPRARRATNVAGAFRVRAASSIRERAIVLVDDVVTSGATARACLSALAGAGAELLCAVSLARTLEPAA